MFVESRYQFFYIGFGEKACVFNRGMLSASLNISLVLVLCGLDAEGPDKASGREGGGSGALNMGTLHGGMPIGVVAHPLQMALER